ARFAAYFFYEQTANAWADLSPVPQATDIYEVTAPEGTWTNVIFCRMNNTTTENNWDNKWNQTNDLTWDGTLNLYTIAEDAWSNGDGVWSAYGVTVPSISLNVPAQVFIDETITLQANAVNVNNPVIAYSVKIPGSNSYISATSPYLPATTGSYTFKAEVSESGNATILASSDEKEVIVKAVPSPITIRIKIPNEWTTVFFYYWTIGEGSFVTPTLDGDWYAYTFNREESISLIFVNGDTWASDPDDGIRLGKQTVNIEGITESTCYEITDATYEDGDSDWGKKRVNTVDCTIVGIATVESTDIVITGNNEIRASFEGLAQIELYSISGQLIRSITVENGFSQKVQKGAYLLRIDGKLHKLIVR
ncbi:MAG: hypothetical protein LBS25_09445, partial [Candidatus Symbiothrix sp.]|nr:hypothetical protein [Candidatus Symbiothrix sp.]